MLKQPRKAPRANGRPSLTPEEAEGMRSAIVDAAREIILEGGMPKLTARNLQDRTGMSVGKIYHYFDDMDAVATAVNSRTLADLDQMMVDEALSDPDASPTDILIGLALAYHHFARQEPKLWSALFERGITVMVTSTADWHLQEHLRLIGYVVKALCRLLPGRNEEACWLHARTLLSAVHGVVFLSVEGRYVAVPRESVDEELRFLVGGFCKGMSAV
jgi:AcrR family transcriptional regulator